MFVSFILLIFTIFGGSIAQQEKIPVTVYYESLCPDSIKFITQELYPVWNSTLKNYMNLTLVPYGKSKTSRSSDGSLLFSCHHGDRECFGNKVQACALKTLSDQDIQVAFINCVMSKTNRNDDNLPYPGAVCANDLNIDYNEIDKCSKWPMGDMYLDYYGNLTNSFQSDLKNVPTIIFNNKFTSENQNEATKNFRNSLCSKLTNKPLQCSLSNLGNLISMNSFVVLSLSIIILITSM